MNPSLLNLSHLSIIVKGLQQEDLESLGMLSALKCLDLSMDHEDLGIHGRFVVGAGLFPCLVHCLLKGFGRPVVFQQGAMPRLEFLRVQFPVQRMREINGSFDLGLGNLRSLVEVAFVFQSGGAGKQDLEKAKAAVRQAIEVHPNHATLKYKYLYMSK